MEIVMFNNCETEFARLLIYYRLQNHLSAVKLAQQLNISDNSIYTYQLGRTVPGSIKTVYKISKVLGIPLNELLSAIYEDFDKQNKLETLKQIPPLKNNFSFFLIKNRNEKNISQEELASLVGIPVKDIQNYESGKCKFDSIELAYKIAKALDVSVNSVINAKLHNIKHAKINTRIEFNSLAAEALYTNRKQALLSIKRLAEISGISSYTIESFEQERNKINSIVTSMQLAKALGLHEFKLIELRCIDLESQN